MVNGGVEEGDIWVFISIFTEMSKVLKDPSTSGCWRRRESGCRCHNPLSRRGELCGVRGFDPNERSISQELPV